MPWVWLFIRSRDRCMLLKMAGTSLGMTCPLMRSILSRKAEIMVGQYAMARTFTTLILIRMSIYEIPVWNRLRLKALLTFRHILRLWGLLSIMAINSRRNTGAISSWLFMAHGTAKFRQDIKSSV